MRRLKGRRFAPSSLEPYAPILAISKPALTVSRPLRYGHPGRLLLGVREQPDTEVMAGKDRFIKALAGGADVRGPLKTTANGGYWLPGLDPKNYIKTLYFRMFF